MLSKTGIHAVRAVADLAKLRPGEYAGASAIAKRIGAPKNYLGKLLQSLIRENIVISQKGLGGGFQLAQPPEDISLYDIVEPIEHVSRWNGCFFGNAQCSEEDPCAVHYRWKEVRDQYIQLLKETTVADLIAKPERMAQVAS